MAFMIDFDKEAGWMDAAKAVPGAVRNLASKPGFKKDMGKLVGGGAAIGAVHGGLKKDEQGNRGGISGAIGGAAKGALGGAAIGAAGTAALGAKKVMQGAAAARPAPGTAVLPAARKAMPSKPAKPDIEAQYTKVAFLTGFDKEASLGSEIGKTVAAPLGFVARQVKGALSRGKAFRKDIASGAKAGFKGQANIGAKKPTGAGLGGYRIKKEDATRAEDLRAHAAGLNAAPKPKFSGDSAEAAAKGKEDVLKRAKKISAKPSFASRHPIATAGGAFLAGKTIFQPKKEDDTSRPAVLYPQGNN